MTSTPSLHALPSYDYGVSLVYRLPEILGIVDWLEGNDLIGPTLVEIEDWFEQVAGGVIGLPFGLALYTDVALHRCIITALLVFGVPRSSMGPRLQKYLGPDPDAKPDLRVV